MPPSSRLTHAGIVVADMDRMIGFFSGALGFEIQHRFRRGDEFTEMVVGLKNADVEVAILGTDASPRQLELLCYHSHPDRPAPRQANALHANHIAVETDDAAGMHERLLAAGGRPISGLVEAPGGAKTVCYAYDPEGGIIEIIQVHDRANEYPQG
ncbi:MAG: hypothetical protein F4Y46_02410 [Chloroflexi bacterium]|nr:hypothetical protein [Chloroflexota bacterium]